MSDLFRKYGFVIVVGATVAALGALAAVRAFDGDGAKPPGQMQASAPARAGGAGGAGGGAAGGGAGRAGGAPEVTAVAIQPQTFYDIVQAIGTAQARESITVTSKVTDVIQRIRFDSGDFVERGDVLVELANVEQTADLAEARASLEVDKREFDRIKELADRGFAPRARVEAAQAAFERSQARVGALESRIADRTIRAPFSGYIGLRQASPGALARPGEVIATLDDISSIKLDFDISETQIAQLRRGAELVARTPAHPGVEFKGAINQLDSRVDPQTRSLKVRAILPNRDRKLRPGMLMTVEVRSNPRQALAAPEIAVLDAGEGTYVFRVEQGEAGATVARVEVEAGQRSGGTIEITSGLTAGDRVVSVGVQRVRPGQPVRVQGATPTEPPTAPPAKAADRTLPQTRS